MYRALHTSRTGMKAYQDRLDVISNNISNSQTDGYKRLDVDFVELIKDSMECSGTGSTDDSAKTAALGTGVRTGVSYRILDQGILVQDENPMAMAIEGEGFFGLQNESGELLLTRNGQFEISIDGNLVNGDGYIVEIDNQESLEGLNPGQLQISNSGELLAIGMDGSRESKGCLKLYRVLSEEYLIDAGESLFKAEEDGVEEIDLGDSVDTFVKQGFVEKSNVDIGQEMVDMMISQRAYQMNARAVQSADDMWSLINNIKR